MATLARRKAAKEYPVKIPKIALNWETSKRLPPPATGALGFVE